MAPMDRIDKFLKRRPEKNRRRVVVRGREFTITKEDVKAVRGFRKNVCMDGDVDLCRPLNLSFSRLPMDALPVREKRHVPAAKRIKWTPRVVEKRSRNEIVDVWEDTLDDMRAYEQDVFVKVGDAYSGSVEALRYGKEDLAKALRSVYLRQYEPREKKQYRLKDLVKDLPDPETLRPFPEEIGLQFKFGGSVRTGFSADFQRLGAAEGRVLGIYQVSDFLRLKTVEFDEEIGGVAFTKDGSVCVLIGSRICVVDDVLGGVSDVFGMQDFETWERGCGGLLRAHTVILAEGKINHMEVHPNGRYVGAVCGKNVFLFNLAERSRMRVVATKGAVPLKVRFHRSLPKVIVSTSNSIIVHGIGERRSVCDTKEFSFVLDFCSVTDDVVAIANNTSKIILFDHSRGVVLRTMQQEDVVTEIVQHRRYSLMCAVSPRGMTVFHNSIGSGLVVPVKTIAGRFRCVAFHPELPWLYAVQGSRLVVFT